MPVKCPRCGSELSPEETADIAAQLVASGIVARKRSKNASTRSDKGGTHRMPKEYRERKPEAESELKKRTSAENGRKGGRPKGSVNKAPRADKGLPRGPRNATH